MPYNKETDLVCNGKFKVLKMTENIHDEVLGFYKENFLKNENVSTACELASTELSIAETEAIVKAVLQDGLGYVARSTETNELVAICVNKILDPASDAILGFQFQSPGLICAGEFVYQMKGSFDLFKEWKLDCAMEIVFLSTRKDCGGHGLATILYERSVEFAKKMLNGTLEHIFPERIKNLKPQAVCSIFTSLFSQKIGEKLGMETLVKIPYTEFFYEGKSFAEKIDPIHKYATFAAMRL